LIFLILYFKLAEPNKVRLDIDFGVPDKPMFMQPLLGPGGWPVLAGKDNTLDFADHLYNIPMKENLSTTWPPHINIAVAAVSYLGGVQLFQIYKRLVKVEHPLYRYV